MSSADGLDGHAFALLIATGSYQDPGLPTLRSPVDDARELAAVLADPVIGGYQVKTLVNEQTHRVNEGIEEFLADRRPDDTLIVYLSCHGVRDGPGKLRFATASTRLNLLSSTAVSADFIYDLVNDCRARHVLVLLDCCYSGAYLKGHYPRPADRVEIASVRDRGRAVITSCSSMQLSFEIDTGRVTGNPVTSPFTTAVIEGLRTGQADRDGDGLVSVDDLYDYVHDRVREVTPHQKPEKKYIDARGDFIIARNPHPPVPPDEPLPADLAEALNSRFPKVRAGAVDEIAALASGTQPGLARTARETLQVLLTDDSKAVSSAAKAALASLSHPATEQPAADTGTQAPILAVQAGQEGPATPASTPYPRVPGGREPGVATHSRSSGSAKRGASAQPITHSRSPSNPNAGIPSQQNAQHSLGRRSRLFFIGMPATLLMALITVTTYLVLPANSHSGSEPIVLRTLSQVLHDPHSKGVHSVAFGPGGSTLAAGDVNGTTYLWNLATKHITASLHDPQSKGAFSVAFGPGGSTLAAGDASGTTYLWNLATKHITATLHDLQSKGIISVAFGPGGTTLAASDNNSTTYLWNLTTKHITTTLHDPQDNTLFNFAFSVAFGPDGTTLAVGDQNGITHLWNLTTKHITASLHDPHSKGVFSVAFGPGGTSLAAGDWNGHIYLWTR